MKRTMDTTDSVVSSLMLCGTEVVSFAGDRANQRHLDECCDCHLMLARWRASIESARILNGKPIRQLELF